MSLLLWAITLTVGALIWGAVRDAGRELDTALDMWEADQ